MRKEEKLEFAMDLIDMTLEKMEEGLELDIVDVSFLDLAFELIEDFIVEDVAMI